MQSALDLCMVWFFTAFACVSTFGPRLSPARMNLVQEVQPSGHGNPIPGRSPLKEESELPGLPAGLVGVIEKITTLRKPGHTAGYAGQSEE